MRKNICMTYVLFKIACATGSLFRCVCLRACGVCECVCVCFYCFLYFWCSADNSPIWNSITKYLLQFETRYGWFFEDLIKYRLSLKYCNTICKKKEIKLKKKRYFIWYLVRYDIGTLKKDYTRRSEKRSHSWLFA